MKTAIYTFAALAVLQPMPARAAASDSQSQREQLVGSWSSSRGAGSGTWVISATNDGLHIVQRSGPSTVADFQCSTEGQNCDVKVGGHKARVSLYYNGPALVELETKGDKVIKRRFSILSTGDTMKLEVFPTTADGKVEELEFVRDQPTAAQK